MSGKLAGAEASVKQEAASPRLGDLEARRGIANAPAPTEEYGP